jgi:hypothetical protein
MHERGRLERMAGLLASHLPARHLAQFRINERQQFVPRAGIALLDRRKNAGDVCHELPTLIRAAPMAMESFPTLKAAEVPGAFDATKNRRRPADGFHSGDYL